MFIRANKLPFLDYFSPHGLKSVAPIKLLCNFKKTRRSKKGCIMKIDWNLPQFRPGFWGVIDKLIGPGATKAEKNLQWYVPLVAVAGIVFWGLYQGYEWSLGQYVLAALLTLDMLGGIITNSTSSAKRWFHREGEGFKAHMGFIALHFIQLTLYSWLFLGLDLIWVAQVGGFMMLSCAAVLLTPLYLQRPTALTLYSLALVLSLYVFEAPAHLEWFLPLFYLKLLISHILREEPYRPESES